MWWNSGGVQNSGPIFWHRHGHQTLQKMPNPERKRRKLVYLESLISKIVILCHLSQNNLYSKLTNTEACEPHNNEHHTWSWMQTTTLTFSTPGRLATAAWASSISMRQPCILDSPYRSPLPTPFSLCLSVFGLSRNAPMIRSLLHLLTEKKLIWDFNINTLINQSKKKQASDQLSEPFWVYKEVAPEYRKSWVFTIHNLWFSSSHFISFDFSTVNTRYNELYGVKRLFVKAESSLNVIIKNVMEKTGQVHYIQQFICWSVYINVFFLML